MATNSGGKATEKNKVGRPPKYTTAEEMQTVIDQYFDECRLNQVPYTITGLAEALDMTRDQVIKYEHKDEFTDTIKKAKLKVENGYELRLIASGRPGDIFALKQFGWTDKQEIESKNLNLNVDVPDEEVDKVLREYGIIEK